MSMAVVDNGPYSAISGLEILSRVTGSLFNGWHTLRRSGIDGVGLVPHDIHIDEHHHHMLRLEHDVALDMGSTAGHGVNTPVHNFSIEEEHANFDDRDTTGCGANVDGMAAAGLNTENGH